MIGKGRGRRVEHSAWALLVVVAAALLALSVASSSNYASVVVANVGAYIVPQFDVAYAGSAPDGTLTPNSTVRVTLALRVENPSSRTLRFQLVAYAGWIEDWPAEDGVNESRRSVDDVAADRPRALFFPAFEASFEVSPGPVPAFGNATLTLAFNLTRASDPQRFDGARNITAYAVARNRSAGAVEWNHWVRVDLTIDGVPPPDAPSAAHLQALRRIERTWGENLA